MVSAVPEHLPRTLLAQSLLQSGYDICLFGRVHVRLDCHPRRNLVTYCYTRYWRKIPDPFLGPKGVRSLLLFRGYTG